MIACTARKQPASLLPQNRQLLCHHLPDDIVVQPVVGVGNDIAERDDATVLAELLCKSWREKVEPPNRLAKNFELTLYRRPEHEIGVIIVAVTAVEERNDGVGGAENISQ